MTFVDVIWHLAISLSLWTLLGTGPAIGYLAMVGFAYWVLGDPA